MKKLKIAIAAGKKDDAKTLLPPTFGLIDKSVQKGVIKENTARRYKSRLATAVTASQPLRISRSISRATRRSKLPVCG